MIYILRLGNEWGQRAKRVGPTRTRTPFNAPRFSCVLRLARRPRTGGNRASSPWSAQWNTQKIAQCETHTRKADWLGAMRIITKTKRRRRRRRCVGFLVTKQHNVMICARSVVDRPLTCQYTCKALNRTIHMIDVSTLSLARLLVVLFTALRSSIAAEVCARSVTLGTREYAPTLVISEGEGAIPF